MQDNDIITIDYTFQPVKPVQYISVTTKISPKKLSWREVLDDLYLKYGTWSDAYPEEQKKLAQLDEVFREKFPGEYIIEEFYNAKLQRFDVRLKFPDPKQETMFVLKNSG